ncbi:hypothetical protein GBA52_016257 [Prunus armeniaca]|nr:hypothetical protein GBA52_016257 [Prunus armeniaca]
MSMIREILPTMVDLEEVLKDHYDSKTRYLELTEVTEDILDKLEQLEGEEEELRVNIAALIFRQSWRRSWKRVEPELLLVSLPSKT